MPLNSPALPRMLELQTRANTHWEAHRVQLDAMAAALDTARDCERMASVEREAAQGCERERAELWRAAIADRAQQDERGP